MSLHALRQLPTAEPVPRVDMSTLAARASAAAGGRRCSAPCLCGGDISVLSSGNVAIRDAVRDHQRSLLHIAWRVEMEAANA